MARDLPRNILLVAVAVTGSLVGCVPSREPPPPAAPQPAPQSAPPAPPPPPPPAADWRDIALTPGGWRYAAGVATFGGAADSLSLTCDRGRNRILLRRAGASGGNLILRTSYGARTLAAANGAAELPARDRLLDEIAFSRGRFTVETPGQPMLVIPAWPEPARVIEDCRGSA